MEYIENNREEVEAEYQQVLDYSEEIRQYWKKRNQKRFAKIASVPLLSLVEKMFTRNCKPGSETKISMITILVDHNIEGHAALLWDTLTEEGWLEIFSLRFVKFDQVGLSHNSNDREVWLCSKV